MHELVVQKNKIVLDFNEECQKIYFIVNGIVDLEIIDKEGKIHTLDCLEQGDFIGQYSVLYISTLVFRIIVKSTTARILTLDDDFFIEYGDKERLDGLKESIDEAVDFEIKYGIPSCDYKKF